MGDECSDLLPIYYKRLYPFSLMNQWLSYGNVNKTYFQNREFALTLPGDIYIRYESFSTAAELEKAVCSKMPEKIDIGAIFNQRPKDHKTSSNFRAMERELIFDIDMDDYNDVRNCCQEKSVCKKCWRFMSIAVKILDRALREDFGFKYILWVYSGRRGVHCWVCDEKARALNQGARSAIVEYLTLIKGGETREKKVYLNEAQLHFSIQAALQIIKSDFEKLQVEEQDFLETKEKYDRVLALVPNDQNELLRELQTAFAQCTDSAERWEHFTTIVDRTSAKNAAKKHNSLKHLVDEVMIQYAYPRLDANVSKGVNHLLKAPFCVHPKTGKVCVPFLVEDVDDFDPAKVPTIRKLIDEINAHGKLNSGEGTEPSKEEKKKGLDYQVTSLKSSMALFKRFISGMSKEWRTDIIEQQDKKMDF